MTSSRPRVGDQIETADQLDALPEVAMVRDHMGDHHVKYAMYRGGWQWQEVGLDTDMARSSREMVREIGGVFAVLYVPAAQPRTPDRHNVQHQIVDELEYRVRTAAALAKGGHDISADVEAGKQRVRFLAEHLIALTGEGKDGNETTPAQAVEQPRTPEPAPATVEQAAEVVEAEVLVALDWPGLPPGLAPGVAHALADAGLLRTPVTAEQARADAIKDAAVWVDRLYPNGLIDKKAVLADLALWADRASRGLRASGREYAAGVPVEGSDRG